MIRISMDKTRTEQFYNAIKVLDECKVKNLPCCGFEHPFMGPGGYYGNCWWERDSSLTLEGYKWLDQDFAEKALLNFCLVQKENGRIPLYGHDRVDDLDEELSAIPVLFEVAYKICRRTRDKKYITAVYEMLCRYMAWWQSDIKRDPGTGLMCGIFEESDPSDFHVQHEAVQVDLNVQIAVGADVLSELARYLGREEDSLKYKKLFREMRDGINKHLWDEDDGMYYTWLVKEKRLYKERVLNSAFDMFKRDMVPSDRKERLMKHLKDNEAFAWNGPFGLTTMSRKCSQYEETTGGYQGSHSWSGNVWSLRNEIIAKGLMESGYERDAAHLALMTIDLFGKDFPEFASPSTGEGHGVFHYGWTASHYIELLIEVILGIDYCAWDERLTIKPNIPAVLYGETIVLDNIDIGSGKHVNVRVVCGESPEVKSEIVN